MTTAILDILAVLAVTLLPSAALVYLALVIDAARRRRRAQCRELQHETWPAVCGPSRNAALAQVAMPTATPRAATRLDAVVVSQLEEILQAVEDA